MNMRFLFEINHSQDDCSDSSITLGIPNNDCIL